MCWPCTHRQRCTASTHVTACACAGTLSPEWAYNIFDSGIPSRLRVINISNNQLVGSIPASWAPLVLNAATVDVSDNKLWGSLGPEWFNVTRAAWATWPLQAVRTG